MPGKWRNAPPASDDPRRREDRYWDAVVRGERTSPAGIDPTLAAAILRIHALDEAPPPAASFVARLEETFMDATLHPGAVLLPLAPPAPSPRNLEREPPHRPTRPRRVRRLWPLLELAAVIALVVSLAGTYFVGHRVLPRLAALWRDDDAPAATANVPIHRGNPARTGGMPGPGPSGTPHLRWRFQTTEPVAAAPVVVDGIVYGTTAGAFGSNDGELYALDAASGTERWRFDAQTPFAGPPTVVGGVVYAGGDDGVLRAVDAATGAERWQRPLGGLGVASPAVVDGVIYTTTGGAVSAPAVAEGMVYVAGGPGYYDPGSTTVLVAVDADTGAERWRFGSEQFGFSAVDAATGQRRWFVPTGALDTGNAAVVDGVVYFGGGDDGNLYAVDAATGAERWRFATGNSMRQSSPAVVDGVVYVGDDGGPVGGMGSDDAGKLHAVDAATGQELWSAETGRRVFCSPTVADGVVYVGSDDNFLYAFDATTGERRWRFEGHGWVRASPVIVDGIVYFGDYGGNLSALGDAGRTSTTTLNVGTPVP